MDLIADVGATNARCGLVNDRAQLVKQQVYAAEQFNGITELLQHFLRGSRATDKPRRAAIAIAAPVLDDEVRMLNRQWKFSQRQLRADLDVVQLIVVNDFAATAWSLPFLKPNQLRKIGQGIPRRRAAMGTIGPGSGLGVGGLIPAGNDGWAAIAGEGGHQSLTPSTETEEAIVAAVRREYGHCSAERLLSGPGLLEIYLQLAALRGRESVLSDPGEVTSLAVHGEPLAAEALNVFFGLLGSVAGDLALTLGAHGGVYVAGGIIPRVADRFSHSTFRERFMDKGRYRTYLEQIPTFLITLRVPAFIGLTALLTRA